MWGSFHSRCDLSRCAVASHHHLATIRRFCLVALPCQATAPLGHFGFTASGYKLIPNPAVRVDVDESSRPNAVSLLSPPSREFI